MEIVALVFALIFVAAFLLVQLIKPRWAVHKHFPALKERLIETSPRALLTADIPQAMQEEQPAATYTVSLDHLNNLGLITYIMHVTLHDLHIFPPGVTCDPFDPHPSQQRSSSGGMLTSIDLLALGQRMSISRHALIAQMFPPAQAARLMDYARKSSLPKLREVVHDGASGELMLTFYIKPRHLRLKRGHGHGEHLEDTARALNEITAFCASLTLQHPDEASKWVALYQLISPRSHQERRALLVHILNHFDRHAEVSKLCAKILEHDQYIPQFVMFRHDPKRFLEAISDEGLRTFLRHYTSNSEGAELDPHAISPERFPEVFGAHLKVDILNDRVIPTVYRIELVRRWLAPDSGVEREALHEAIATMSDRDQLQLRAALESDASMSGALSSIDSQAGKLTLDT